MKKTKKDPLDERAELIASICDSIKDSVAKKALRYRLSPLEMMTVLSVLSSTMCDSISKHFGIELLDVVETFCSSMKSFLNKQN